MTDRKAPEEGGVLVADGSATATLREKVTKLTWAIEKMDLSQYIALLKNPWRLVWVNFLAGTARGLGIAFGFAVLSATLLYLLQASMWAHLPVIGSYIATIVRLVEHNLRP
ncbi:MAG: DUF5665 domain-containing protein [Mycobacterium leprae]